jgi:2-dehydro-3-deoxyphosphogluconate aldolase/(4S)-4-hydroxy-2-oxoglutarate aldolase
MTRIEVRARIEEIGIVPGIRVATAERACFAAEAVGRAGIPLAEITMAVPNAIGGGTVLDIDTARRSVDAGARFLTSTGLVHEVVEYALKNDVLVFPGAMTPTEVIAAWKTGADFVKVFPCAPLGGPSYLRSLKLRFPQMRLIATGGVNQRTAANFILAGASALGIGTELINPEALPILKEEQIYELARRYLGMVKAARAQKHDGRRI